MEIYRLDLLSYLHVALEHSKETDVKHRGIPVGSESAYTAGIRQTINEVSQMRSAKVEIKEV